MRKDGLSSFISCCPFCLNIWTQSVTSLFPNITQKTHGIAAYIEHTDTKYSFPNITHHMIFTQFTNSQPQNLELLIMKIVIIMMTMMMMTTALVIKIPLQ